MVDLDEVYKVVSKVIADSRSNSPSLKSFTILMRFFPSMLSEIESLREENKQLRKELDAALDFIKWER